MAARGAQSFVPHVLAIRGLTAAWGAGQVRATCYCLNANDKSKWRVKIESSVERFIDLHMVLGQQGAQAVAMKARPLPATPAAAPAYATATAAARMLLRTDAGSGAGPAESWSVQALSCLRREA